MAEYIDREKLIKKLIDKGFYPALVKSAIENAPAEDVVPKSEVEDLKELIKVYKSCKEELAIKHGITVIELQLAKQEVERLIFEEIENLKYTILGLQDIVSWEDIAELKNKYIGE
jgi:hypothetical protein